MAKVKTGIVRFSYVHLFEPHKISEDQDPTYSVMAIIDKDDKATLSALQKAYKEAIQEGKERYGEKFAPTPFVRAEGGNRGVVIDADKDPRYMDNKDFAGHYLMNAKSKTIPGVLAKETGRTRLTPENGSEIVYSGCYGKLSISLFPYSNMGFGIGVGLNNVLKTKDGAYLGGRASAEADFADELDDDEDLDELL